MSLKKKFVAELRLAALDDIEDYDILSAEYTTDGLVDITLYDSTLDLLLHLDEFSTIHRDNIQKLMLILVDLQPDHMQVVQSLPHLTTFRIRFRQFLPLSGIKLRRRPPQPGMVLPHLATVVELHLYGIYPEELNIDFEGLPNTEQVALEIEPSRQSPDLFPSIDLNLPKLTHLSIRYRAEIELRPSLLEMPLKELYLKVGRLTADSQVIVNQLREQGVSIIRNGNQLF